MLTVLYDAVSMVAGTLVRVVTVPVLLLATLPVTDTAAVLVQLKQYSVVPLPRSLLGNVTVWPLEALAVPMPGHAVPPVGQPVVVVLTVQLLSVGLTV